MIADRLHWTPQQVDALDPDFVDELLAFFEADAKNTRKRLKSAERGDTEAELDD